MVVELDSPVGTLFAGRFQLKALLGRGGMGAVYLAEHMVLSRDVAVKLLHQDLLKDPNIAARFRQEARAASRIANPHVTSVFDFGHSEDGRPYLVMEYVPGETVAAVLDRGERFSVPRSLRILIQVADGLVAAHASQVVHRDLQPRNIVLSDRRGRRDFVKILDFGLAKLIDQVGTGRTLTGDGTAIGTPAYMSPEQCMGETIGPAADIYGLGSVAFELLTGAAPFQGSVIELVAAHMHQQPPRPSSRLQAPLPPGLDGLVLRCLAKRPDERPTSAMVLDELTRVYRALPEGEPVSQMRAAYLVTSTKWFGRDPGPAEETLPVRPAGEETEPSTAHDPLGRSGSTESGYWTLCDLAFTLRDRGLGPVALSELAAALLAAGDRLLEDEVQLTELERERTEVEVRSAKREARLRQALAQLEHERQRLRSAPGMPGRAADDDATSARLDRSSLELSGSIQHIVAEADQQLTIIDQKLLPLRAAIGSSRDELQRKEQLLLATLVQTVAAESSLFDQSLRDLFDGLGLGWHWPVSL